MKTVSQNGPFSPSTYLSAGRSLLLAGLILLEFVSPINPQKAELVVQTGHIGEVASVEFSPDGRQIVSTSLDGTCKLWDTATGQELRTFADPPSSLGFAHVRSAHFSRDGKRIFTLDSGQIKVWDASNASKLATIGDYGAFEKFVISEQADLLVAVTGTSVVKLYDSVSGAFIRDLVYHTKFVWERIDAVAVSPNGKLVAGGSPDKTIKLWDAATGEQVRPPMNGHTDGVSSVAFSPDGKLLASAGGNDTVRLWDAATGTPLQTVVASRGVGTMAFSPDGKRIIGGDGGGAVTQWDVGTGGEIWSVQAHNGQFSRTVNSVAVNGTGTQIVSGGNDKAVKLWDLKTGGEIRTMSGNTPPLTYAGLSPNGKQLITGSTYDGTIKLWDLEGSSAYRLLADKNVHAQVMDYSPDGKTIVTTGGGIRLWNAETGELIKIIDPGYKGGVPNSVMFTPDGKQLVTSNEDSTLKLWDVASGSLVKTLFVQTHMADQAGDNVEELAYSQDGKWFVTATSNGKVALWDSSSVTQVRPMAGQINVSRLMFSPDGTEVVGGVYYERILKFWKVSTGEEIKYDTPPAWANLNAGGFAFGHLGGMMVKVETNGGKVTILDAKTGRELASVVWFGDTEWAVTTPEGRLDTNKNLEYVNELHYVISDEPFTPRPLEFFRWQYYEPNLLVRILKCNSERELGKPDPCEKEFRPLPSLSKINRARPRVSKPTAVTQIGKIE